MFRQFYPTVYYRSAYSIDFRELYEKGYRGLLTDVDNTLVEHGAPANEEAEAFFNMLHNMGWKTCIVSNNDEDRVAPFAVKTNSLYICNAGKPGKEGYLRGMKKMGTDSSDTLFIGDQLFTDIWGANRAGIPSLLVDPVSRDYLFHIRLKRAGESIVKIFYRRFAAKHPGSL